MKTEFINYKKLPIVKFTLKSKIIKLGEDLKVIYRIKN